MNTQDEGSQPMNEEAGSQQTLSPSPSPIFDMAESQLVVDEPESQQDFTSFTSPTNKLSSKRTSMRKRSFIDLTKDDNETGSKCKKLVLTDVGDETLFRHTRIPFQDAGSNELTTLTYKSAGLINSLSPDSLEKLEESMEICELPVPTVMEVLSVEFRDESKCAIIYNYRKDKKRTRVKSDVSTEIGLLVNKAKQTRPIVLIYMGEGKTGDAIFRTAESHGCNRKINDPFNSLYNKSLRQIQAYFTVAHLHDFPPGSVIAYENPGMLRKCDTRWNKTADIIVANYRCMVNGELLIGDLSIPAQIASSVVAEKSGVIVFKGLRQNTNNMISYDIILLSALQAFIQTSELFDTSLQHTCLSYFDENEKHDPNADFFDDDASTSQPGSSHSSGIDITVASKSSSKSDQNSVLDNTSRGSNAKEIVNSNLDDSDIQCLETDFPDVIDIDAPTSKIVDAPKYPCPVCNELYTEDYITRVHMNTHFS